jgi:hypothetical protein
MDMHGLISYRRAILPFSCRNWGQFRGTWLGKLVFWPVLEPETSREWKNGCKWLLLYVWLSHTQRLLCEIFHSLVLSNDFGCSVYHRMQYKALSATLLSAPLSPALCQTVKTAVLPCRVWCQQCLEPAVIVDFSKIGSACCCCSDCTGVRSTLLLLSVLMHLAFVWALWECAL